MGKAKEPEIVEDTQEEVPQTVNINGVDYPIEEATEYIETGKKTKELETQWNTKLDKVWPEYGQLSTEKQNWLKEKEDLESKLKSFQEKKDAGVETNVDVQKAREAAKKLGLLLDEDIEKAGYVKKEDLPGLFKSYSEEQEGVRKVLSEADQLEKEIDGSDGRPKFNKKVVLAYASSYQIPGLKEAYEEMNKESLDAWKTAQVAAKKNKGLDTLDGGKEKAPRDVKVTDDNVKDLLRETLYGNNE